MNSNQQTIPGSGYAVRSGSSVVTGHALSQKRVRERREHDYRFPSITDTRHATARACVKAWRRCEAYYQF